MSEENQELTPQATTENQADAGELTEQDLEQAAGGLLPAVKPANDASIKQTGAAKGIIAVLIGLVL